MSQSNSKTTIRTLGTAVATGTLVAGSLFSMQAMAGGYMQDVGKMDAKHAHEGGCGMAMMDTDKDGRLSRAEFDAEHKGREEKFAAHDANGDGFITQAEMDAHHAAEAKAKGGDKATTEGKCGEGKCGEGKCGGNP